MEEDFEKLGQQAAYKWIFDNVINFRGIRKWRVRGLAQCCAAYLTDDYSSGPSGSTHQLQLPRISPEWTCDQDKPYIWKGCPDNTCSKVMHLLCHWLSPPLCWEVISGHSFPPYLVQCLFMGQALFHDMLSSISTFLFSLPLFPLPFILIQ